MKRTIAIVVVLLAAFAAGAVAQDRLFGWSIWRDRTLPEHPCVVHGGIQGAAQPFYYDHQALVFYTCADSTVVLRTFFNPADSSREATPVYMVPTLPAAPICPAGFVESRGGGCVPPNHPDAKPQ
jgi:hypothetical protein